MDTHIASAPNDGHAGAPLQSPMRLPGARGTLPHSEPPDDIAIVQSRQHPQVAATHSAAPAPVAVVAPPRRRRRLLGTVATLALLAGSADAVWLHRHDIMNLPWHTSMTTALRAGEARLRPQLALWSRTLRATALQVAAALPTPEHAVAAPAHSMPAAEAELASLKPDEGQPEAAVAGGGANSTKPGESSPAAVSTKPSSAPTEIGVAAVPADGVRPAQPTPATPASTVGVPVLPTPPGIPIRAASQSSTAATSPATTTAALAAPLVTGAAVLPTAPATFDWIGAGATYIDTARWNGHIPWLLAASPPSPPAPSKPRDPVEAATKLLAAPLSSKQQIEVVGFVRELGAQLKDTRTTVAQLNDTVTQLKQEIESRTADFDSRLSFAEASSALMQSAKAGEKAKLIPAAAQPAIHPVALTQGIAAASASRMAKEFRIQGASPGLVVLNVLDPAVGEEPVLYKALGDQVPGLGRIKAIYQRGTRWLVQTEGGLIQ